MPSFFFLCYILTLVFFFPYSEISSSFASKHAPDCVPVPCQGKDFFPNEDCTKVGCECKPCSFGRASYGEFYPGLPPRASTHLGERRTLTFGHVDLLWSLALACSTLLEWLYIGVKDTILGLWVLSLLALALLDVWRSVGRYLDGVEGPGPASWILVASWLAVLTSWTLATYQSVEVLRINLVLWALTLLRYGVDAARVHGR